jgi:transcriptional regulator with XRE-family HTH domain
MKNISSGLCFSDTIGYGERIKEERQRLKLTQADFAKLAGVSRQSQANYETEEREPSAAYLINLYDRVDVSYILSGRRSGSGDIDAKVVEAILNAIDGWAAESKRQIPQNIKAELLSLFLKQAMSTGKIESEWMKQTLRLVK